MPDDLAPSRSSDLYERDFYAWTQAQTRALLTRGAETPLEYERLAEEINDLGTAEWNRARTLITRILHHLYKLDAGRNEQPKAHWRSEIRQFRIELEDGLTRSIRNGMEADLEKLHRRAATVAQADMADSEPDVHIDTSRRWTLAQVVGEARDPIA